jgi:hypothetical protein
MEGMTGWWRHERGMEGMAGRRRHERCMVGMTGRRRRSMQTERRENKEQ